MVRSFNRTINYIETVLESEIDQRKISELSGYSYALFSRLFSILTGITLAEYIRLRKLTESAVELRESGDKIISIAMKYGYDSPDSFGVAFKNFHGHTPSEVRKGKAFKVFSYIQLSLSIKGGRMMDISIQKKSGFTAAGVKLEAIDSSLCPTAWDKLFKQAKEEELKEMGSGQAYGMCYGLENNDKINYMACYDVTNIEMAQKMNLDFIEVPENEYAILKLKGAIPDSIQKGWEYLLEVFFPEQGYKHSGAPDFELYKEGDMYSKNYEMELWVPVVKTSGN